MKNEPDIILASASPRRKALMEDAGYLFKVIAADADETLPGGVPPQEAAIEVARRKALAVAHHAANAIVIGADTIVVTPAGEILGKPIDAAHAREMLAGLSDTTHRVITGVWVTDTRSGRQTGRAVVTQVVFGRMSPAQIDEYVDSGEALGKAGAYAIQETGDRFVREVRGSFSNVVGLPMEALAEMLEEIWGFTPA